MAVVALVMIAVVVAVVLRKVAAAHVTTPFMDEVHWRLRDVVMLLPAGVIGGVTLGVGSRRLGIVPTIAVVVVAGLAAVLVIGARALQLPCPGPDDCDIWPAPVGVTTGAVVALPLALGLSVGWFAGWLVRHPQETDDNSTR